MTKRYDFIIHRNEGTYKKMTGNYEEYFYKKKGPVRYLDLNNEGDDNKLQIVIIFTMNRKCVPSIKISRNVPDNEPRKNYSHKSLR